MLDRRTFIKSLAALGVAGVMPQSLKAGVGLGDEAMPLLAVNNMRLESPALSWTRFRTTSRIRTGARRSGTRISAI